MLKRVQHDDDYTNQPRRKVGLILLQKGIAGFSRLGEIKSTAPLVIPQCFYAEYSGALNYTNLPCVRPCGEHQGRILVRRTAKLLRKIITQFLSAGCFATAQNDMAIRRGKKH